MVSDRNAPERGEIWLADLGPLNPAKGAEVQKTRPVLIVGTNIVNRYRRTVLVVPLATFSGKAVANPPITVEVRCAGKQAVAVIDQLRALDKGHLLRNLEVIDDSALHGVEEALSQILEI